VTFIEFDSKNLTHAACDAHGHADGRNVSRVHGGNWVHVDDVA